MKILIVNKFLYPNGGSETYIFKIGQELMRLGHEVQYFGMEHEGRIVGNHANSYTEDMSFHGGGISKLTYPFKILYSRDSRKKIRTVLEDFRPDVVHLNNINFQITPSIIDEIKAFGPGIRIIYTAHDYQWVCPNHMLKIPSTGELCTRCIHGDYSNCTKNRCIHDSKAQSVLGTLEAKLYQRRETYRLVDTIICPSEFMNRMLSSNPQLKGRTITLHNFYEEVPEEEMPDQKIMERLPQRYALYFGRYDEEKGIKTLLKVCQQLPDIPFVFAGKGTCADQVRATKNITELGFLSGETLRYVIRHAAFSLYPSEWYENCPFSVVESQLLGTPVIASRIGGIPELLSDQKTGELFAAGDAAELKSKIERLWQDQDKIASYHSQCRDYVTQNMLTLTDYCSRLLEFYCHS